MQFTTSALPPSVAIKLLAFAEEYLQEKFSYIKNVDSTVSFFGIGAPEVTTLIMMEDKYYYELYPTSNPAFSKWVKQSSSYTDSYGRLQNL